MTPDYEIYGLRYGREDFRPESEMYLDGNPAVQAPGLDFYFWVIRGGGRVWVVDCGYAVPVGDRLGHDTLYDPADGLRRLGIDPATVSDVVVTHCHYDHVGNLDAFPQAMFHIQDREMLTVTGRDVTHPALKMYGKRNTLALVGLNYDGRMRFHDGDGELAPGLSQILIGGHSRGQIALEVATRRGPVIVASDAVHLYDEMERVRPFRVFYDLKEMLEGYRTLGARMLSRDHLIPGHDPELVRRFPAAGPEFEGEVVRFDLEPAPT